MVPPQILFGLGQNGCLGRVKIAVCLPEDFSYPEHSPNKNHFFAMRPSEELKKSSTQSVLGKIG